MQQLVITRQENKIVSSLFEQQSLIQVHVERDDTETILGNIYVGKVKNIVKNINAAFVEIADGQICYYPLSERVVPIFCKGKKGGNVCIGDEMIIQVSKDAIKTKQPSVTGKLQFAGKYAVLTYGDDRISISSKICEEQERTRLSKMVRDIKAEKKGFGIIVRTNAAQAEEALVEQEIRTFIKVFESIRDTGVYKSCFSLLYQAPTGYLCDIRDGYETEVESILTDDTDIYQTIHAYLMEYQPQDLGKLQQYTDPMITLDRLYGVQTKVEKALQPKVWLKSGGYLVIQPTEALTVIDVNTGKAIEGKKAVEKHFLKINEEAAVEIAKQLRLRNLSGIIIIDFIDLELEASKKQLIRLLEQEIKKDPVKTVFVDMTKLNLVELTRKKVRRPLHEQW